MNARERFVAEIERIENAIKTTKSNKMKCDYKKAVKRMRLELQEYDKYMGVV